MEPAPAPEAVVFDNDGLLLDTESVWTRAERDLFERHGTGFTPADKRELVGSSTGVAGAGAAGLTVIGVPSVGGVALEEAHHLAESLLDDVIALRLAL